MGAGSTSQRKQQGRRCRAVYEWNAAAGAGDGHLSFSENEEFELLSEDPSGWWTGRNAAGAEGIFPGNRVEVLAPSPTGAAVRSKVQAVSAFTEGAGRSAPRPPPPHGAANATPPVEAAAAQHAAAESAEDGVTLNLPGGYSVGDKVVSMMSYSNGSAKLSAGDVGTVAGPSMDPSLPGSDRSLHVTFASYGGMDILASQVYLQPVEVLSVRNSEILQLQCRITEMEHGVWGLPEAVEETRKVKRQYEELRQKTMQATAASDVDALLSTLTPLSPEVETRLHNGTKVVLLTDYTLGCRDGPIPAGTVGTKIGMTQGGISHYTFGTHSNECPAPESLAVYVGTDQGLLNVESGGRIDPACNISNETINHQARELRKLRAENQTLQREVEALREAAEPEQDETMDPDPSRKAASSSFIQLDEAALRECHGDY